MALNHKDFQSIVDGKVIEVADLTEKQAKDELCKLMLLLENIEQDIFSAQVRINEWRA